MIQEITKTSIPLTPQEVVLVQVFLEHLDKFIPIIQADLFSMKNGSATINFDKDGTLQSIEKKFLAYRLTKT